MNMLYIAMYHAISDQKAQSSKRESIKIVSDIFANYKYNSQIRLKNAQKAEHVFGIRLLLLRKTSVLRND